jgi:hypothetical protein
VDGCAVLRLDGFRAIHGEEIVTFGDTRYISLDLSEIDAFEEEAGALLVVDLPLNNGLDLLDSLGYPTPNAGDLLAFEINLLDNERFNDGGCYTMLGVDFFESAVGDPTVTVTNAEVFTNLTDVTGCGECVLSDQFDRPNSNDVGNGWVEFEADADDVAVVNDMLRLRDDGDPDDDPALEQVEAQAVQFGLDISDYESLTLSFEWTSLGATVPTDRFYVQWRACDDPANISTNSEIGVGPFLAFFEAPLVERNLTAGPFLPDTEAVSVALPQAAIDAECIDLRFLTIVSNPEEGVLIDYVDLCGQRRPPVRYTCGDGFACAEAVDGEYATLDECEAGCVEPEPRYTCLLDRGEVGIACAEAVDGEYATLGECEAACVPTPEPRFSCEIDTNGGTCVADEQGPYTEADCLQGVCDIAIQTPELR